MSMNGVFVNTIAVIIGSLIGLALKKGIPDRVANAVMTGVGLCTLYIGISGALVGQNILIVIAAIVIGSIIGTIIDIDHWVNELGDWVERKFQKNRNGKVSLSEGFVTASLLLCVGAMAVNGSLNSGISGDNSILYTKAVLDFFAAAMLSVSLGIGVLFSAASVLVFEGLIVLLAACIAPFLTEAAIAEMNCVGSIIIIGLSMNIIGITNIKVANYLPAIAIAPLLVSLVSLF